MVVINRGSIIGLAGRVIGRISKAGFGMPNKIRVGCGILNYGRELDSMFWFVAEHEL